MVHGTLNELSQLRQSGFGQPLPRHGLNLLYWFANEYIEFSYGEIVLKFRPQHGDFGFKMFHNKIEDEDEDHIVPIQNLPYYEVGNLNALGANKLPHYVRNNKSNDPNSNKDRIIVRLDGYGKVNRVYVTEHSDSKNFDSSKTYRVSQGLLQIISNIEKEQFLSAVTQQQFSASRDEAGGYRQHSRSVSPPPQNDSWCAIL